MNKTTNWMLAAILVICGAIGLTSCSNDDDSAEQHEYTGVPFIIFTPSATGNCRYQLPGTEEWAAQMLEKIRKANKQR